MLFRSLDCLHARTADSRLTVIQCSSTVVKSPLALLSCATWGDRRHSSPFLRVPAQALHFPTSAAMPFMTQLPKQCFRLGVRRNALNS